jgi:hypothetical protein
MDRRRVDSRLGIPCELRHGWLALQARSRKLRLVPIPEGWMHLSDSQLSSLVAREAARTKAAS